MKAKKQKKHIVKTILLVILGLVLLAVITLLLISHFSYLHERKEHEKAGYYHGVDIGGGRKMNVVALGKENGTHTIVGLAGMWEGDYCISMSRINEVIGVDNTLVYVDRAGNGFSDDTLKKQTVSQVVDDYRNALQKAGYEAPYVLMPFSLGGLYATYWESKYPDEIEGVAYIDGTCFTGDIDARGEGSGYVIDEFSDAEILAGLAGSLLGVERFIPYEGVPMGMTTLTDEERRLRVMSENRGYTFAMLSEARHEYELFHETGLACVKNDIPKIYINSTYTCAEDLRDYMIYMDQEMIANGNAPGAGGSPDSADYIWEHFAKEEAEYNLNMFEIPFVEAVGNCEMISIPGDHWIFLQKPDEVSQAIMAFLETLPDSAEVK